MLINPFRDFKYHKYLSLIDTKFSEKYSIQLNQFKALALSSTGLDNIVINPFVIPISSILSQDQLAKTILLIAKQAEETTYKNYNLSYLETFVQNNYELLFVLLQEKENLSQFFSFSILRYLQEQIKINQLRVIQKSKIFPLITLFSSLLQKKQNSIGTYRYYDKENCSSRHKIFKILVIMNSINLLRQIEIQQICQANYLNQLIKSTVLCIHESQNDNEFELMRDLISVLSNIMVLNQNQKMPQKIVDFCLDYKLQTKEFHIKLSVSDKILQKYIESLKFYIKLDPLYHATLHIHINNLLSLKISNSILSHHFDILIYLLKQKVNPQFNKKVFKILVQNQQIRKHFPFINQNYHKLLNSGIDLLEDELQKYSIKLIKICNPQIKGIFARFYLLKYNQNNNQVLIETINLIFQIYLDLGIQLFKIEFMVSNEAKNITSSNILKLHSKIQEKSLAFHLSLLSIILEKRVQGNFKANFIDINCPFIQEDWLIASGNNPQIYNIYMKIITENLCQNTLEINPALINMNSCIIRIQGELFMRSLQFYQIILKIVEQNQVFQEKLFRYLLLCQAILGEKLPIEKYSYFSKYFSKIVRPESLFLMYMEYLVTLVKNKSSFLLYIQALLQFQKNLPELFFQKKLYDISFLVRLIEQSQFFRVSTYSIQSVAALFELSLIVKDQSFQQDYMKIIMIWSGNMSRSQSKSLTYFYIFREIKRIYPYMTQPELKNPKDRIIFLWNLLFTLLDRDEESRQYLDMSPNKFIIEWKGDEIVKKGLQIEGTIIRNHNIEIFWHIHVETNMRFYKLNINNDRLVIYVRNSNEEINKPLTFLKELPIKELKKNPEKIKLKLKIQSVSKLKSNFELKLMQKSVQEVFQGNIQSIRICCKNNAFLYNTTITDLVSSGQFKQITSHLNLFNRWEVKITSLNKIKIQKFIDKFDFDHAFIFIGQMLRNFKPIDLSSAYELLFQLSTRLIKYVETYKQKEEGYLKIMMKVFSIIQTSYSKFRGRNKELKAVIRSYDIKFCSKTIYYLFASAIFPRSFWQNFSLDTQQNLRKTVLQLLDVDYFKNLENMSVDLFDKIIKLSFKFEDLFTIIHKIIKKHLVDDILIVKFQFYFKLAMDNNKCVYKKHLQALINELVQYLNVNNHDFAENRHRSKTLIIGNLEACFQMSSIQSKTSILQYLSQPSEGDKKQHKNLKILQSLIKLIPSYEKPDLIPWIITESKLSLLINKIPYKEKEITEYRYIYYKCHLYLQLLLLHKNEAQESQKALINQLIHSLCKQLKKMIENVSKVQIYKRQFQDFFIKDIYVGYMIQLGNACDSLFEKNNKKDIVANIQEELLDIITRFQKNNFLIFLTKYRKMAEKSWIALKSLIIHEKFKTFKTLKLYSYSIFLQYIYEVLILMEYTLDDNYIREELRMAIKLYLEYFINNVENNTKIGRPFLYAYPHITGERSVSSYSTDNIMKKVKKMQKCQVLQLKGGIYFKLILIIFKLISFNHEENYTNLIEIFIFGCLRKDKKKFQSSRFTNISSKERSQAELSISQSNELYRAYYSKEDRQFLLTPEEIDINNYIIDYMLMSLAEYLYNNSRIIDHDILTSYNRCLIDGLAFKLVYRDMFQNALPEVVELLTYRSITNKFDGNNMFRLSKEICSQDTNPAQTFPISPSYSALTNSPVKRLEEGFDFNFLDLNFTNVRAPSRTARKASEDPGAQIKKKAKLYALIKSDEKIWYSNKEIYTIFKYFHDRAKQIRLIELFHTHFVLQGTVDQTQASFITNKNKNKIERQIIYEQKLQEEYFLNYETQQKIDQMSRKVRKIKPYTCQNAPVFKIMENGLKNNTLPITLKVIPADYCTKRFKNLQSLNMNFYQAFREKQQNIQLSLNNEQEWPEQIEENLYNEPIQYQEIEEQTAIKTTKGQNKSFCEFITREGAYFCVYKINRTKKTIEFQSLSERPCSQELWYLKLGTPTDNIIKKSNVKLVIQMAEIQEIYYRKFNQISYNALQFFMKNGTSKFVSFYNKSFNENVSTILEKYLKSVKWIKDPAKQFQDMKYTEKWVQGNMSNFDYLMLLNKYGGRSYNDLNQYYVFPWVLSDYDSSKLDLTNYKSFRDLGKPVGALNPEKLSRYKEKYRNQTHKQRCYYGSHYSTSLFVFYYLLRLEPFSSLHREMQNGQWDVADRLFCSISEVWSNLMCQTATPDIKECIPEFYYMPSFLKNIAHIEFGQKQNGQEVQDVSLPAWASSPQEFVITMRAALESDYVSENLHLWIDLIFGKYQNSVQKHNVFHPYAYADPDVFKKMNKKNVESLEGVICHISYFGQCPIQLFKKEHKAKKVIPKRLARRQSIQDKSSEVSTALSLCQQVNLPYGWKLLNFYSENQDFILEIDSNIKQEKLQVIIPSQTLSIKECFQQFTPYKKMEKDVLSDQKIKYKDLQLRIGNEFLMDIEINFQFQKFECNQLWIACFGVKGLKIYDWQMQLYWSWEKNEVNYVHLQATRLIFSTPRGSLVFYSFYDTKIQEIHIFKDICEMNIKVICLPRLPNRGSNQINYRVLCIGDNKRLSIAQYTFEQTKNYTSNLHESITLNA